MDDKNGLSRDKKISKNLNFTISSGSGDGAYLCIEKTTNKIYNYFEKNKLNLEEYALDYEYAKINNIPEEMQPFEPGIRASFGDYQCGMTAADYLELTVEDEESNRLFSGTIPKSNLKKDSKASDSLKMRENGVYVVGYEGLEDCYISGKLELDSDFELSKFKIKYGHIDYEIGDRKMITSITYDKNEVDWQLDSYEGTGDNSFGFIIVEQ